MTERYEEKLSDQEIADFAIWAKENTEDFMNLYKRKTSQQFYLDNYPIYLTSLKNNTLKKAS
jgi:hypothetical protein